MAYKASASAGLRCRALWLKLLSLHDLAHLDCRRATQPNSQENADVKEALLKAQELLAKANGGTCSNSCNCVIA